MIIDTTGTRFLPQIEMEGKAELKDMFPKSLDEIIRLRRDELSLRLSTTEDFAKLPPMVSMLDNQKRIKATVNDWRIVCLDFHHKGKQHILVGEDAVTGNTWATSGLKSVDFENSLVLTQNSIYRLGDKGEGEPTFYILLHICHMFHRWGFGAGFGVLEIFY